ncbi:MAG: ferrous iron transporter B [Phycisphaerales bacterium]|nr:ferrous iron transporter B [Phycisphaerales bacterium]
MNKVQASVGGVTPGHGLLSPRGLRIALLGNPNTGKTTLFNQLSGLRHKTSNFPGTTQEARTGLLRTGDKDQPVELIDLPGVYSLELDLHESDVCRRVLAGTLAPAGEPARAPDVLLVVVDATNLARNLLIVGEAIRRRLPTLVALNMHDLARKRGLHFDLEALSSILGCPVFPCSARSGEGLSSFRDLLARAQVPHVTPPGSQDGLEAWARETFAAVVRPADSHARASGRVHSFTDRLDTLVTHPILGLVVFLLVMLGLFWTIFSLATVPMDLIDGSFSWLADQVRATLPPGILADFLAGGVVNGVGGTLVFLPQICILFFLISLLEGTGYLARAAFVVNRYLAPFGLSGHAFVPLLASHACALPGIMSCRAIPDRRERLAAILVTPFASCSARIPVYVLLTVILFPQSPAMQALAFAACYALGIAAALLSALIARRTLLRGASRPMALELPTYKLPSLRTAIATTVERAWVFVRNAGTSILAICIVLWWLGEYPHVEPPARVAELRARAESLATSGEQAAAQPLLDEANRLQASDAGARSFIGRIGRTVQPVFEPLGFDWKLSVGVVSSFAAREVFVSTMRIMVTGHADDEEDDSVMQELRTATRDDGTPIFTAATSWSLLVYYVLAMQCLPTLAVTAREAGSRKWAFLQLGWMFALAYAAAFLVRIILRAAGVP